MNWHFGRKKSELYPWDIAYFEHLVAEFRALDMDPNDPVMRRVHALIEQFANQQNQVSRSILLELEQTLLSVQPTATLLQRAPVLRLRYHDIVGDRQYAAYTPADLTKCGTADEAIRKSLLADLHTLVSGIHWRYILSPLLDQVQTHLTTRVIQYILFYTAIWGGAVALSAGYPFLTMSFTVVFAGLIGGYISSLRRMQSVAIDSDSLFVIQSVQSGSYFLWLSPLLGAIFALVLMLIFLGKLVGGPVFPSFAPWPAQIDQSIKWPGLVYVKPLGIPDYACLYLWSFIAGFAERFVPDVLDRVIQRGQNAAATNVPKKEVSETQLSNAAGNGPKANPQSPDTAKTAAVETPAEAQPDKQPEAAESEAVEEKMDGAAAEPAPITQPTANQGSNGQKAPEKPVAESKVGPKDKQETDG